MKFNLRPMFGSVLLALALGFSGCKKEKETTPADNLVGIYSYEARVNSGFGSFTSGKLKVFKVTGNQVVLVLAPQTEPSDLLSGSPEFYYDVKGLDLNQIPTADTISNPFLSLIVPTGARKVYTRNSTGKISGSYLMIDGTFSNPNYDSVNFSIIAVKDR